MNPKYRIEDVQEEFADGHLTQFSDEFPNFLGTLHLPFARSFSFLCNVSPSSWSFEVTFQEMPNDGSVSCTVLIRRYDNTPVALNVGFWMKMLAAPFSDLQPTTFNLERMPGARQIRRTFHGVISREVIEKNKKKVLIQVSFGVNGCHKEKDLKKRRDRRERTEDYRCQTKPFFSKM